LRSHGVHSTFHYVPLHMSEMGQRFGGKIGLCPIAETVSERLIRLPLYYGLTEENLSQIVEIVMSFHCI
jgi:dTDP-4-amino-4,6-dideoxygalactose transaminase